MNKKKTLLLIAFFMTAMLNGCNSSHNHQFGEWTITKDSTCKEVGIKVRTCSCGEEEMEFISKKEHTQVKDEALNPNCTENGKTEGLHCSVCNLIIKEQSQVDALGHNYDINVWQYQDETGHAHVCDECGVLEIKEHISSGSASETTSEICTQCGYVITPATGHINHVASKDWSADELKHWHACEYCDAKKFDSEEHDLPTYTITKNASTSEEGTAFSICRVCNYESNVKILKTPIISKNNKVITWESIPGATGYSLYCDGILTENLGDVTSYETSSFDMVGKEISIKAYTNNKSYLEYSELSNNTFLNDFEINYQAGLGTDFEVYNKTEHSKLYADGTMDNGWKKDSNGKDTFGILSGYQGVKLFDDNGNTALKIAGSKEYIYAAMDINDTINNPGTYKFTFRAKLGPTANKIGNIFFRFHDRASSAKDNNLLSTPIYFRKTSEPTVTDPLSKDEWVTMEAMFTVTKDLYTTSSYGPTIAEADRNLTIVMATYTYGTETTGTDNHAGNYMLLDDFKVYKAENLKATIGTDFEGYSEETHPELFSDAQFTSQGTGNYYDFTNYPKVSYAKEIIKSNETKAHGLWFADRYGQNAFAMQASYEDLRLTKETDGNVALKVSKGNGTLTRIGLNVDASLLKPGTYMATMKVKSASAETTASGKILFKLNYSTNLFANGNLTDGFYFVGNSSDKSSAKYNVFPTDEYTTVSVQFTITEDLTSKNLCAALVVYAPTTGSLLIDDFKIYG